MTNKGLGDKSSKERGPEMNGLSGRGREKESRRRTEIILR